MGSKKRSKYAYFFLIPFIIVFLVFSLYPILYSIYLSFCEMDALSGNTKFIGLANYERLLSSGYFLESIGNTLKYLYDSAFERFQFGYGAAVAVGIFFVIVFFSMISLLLTRQRKGRR